LAALCAVSALATGTALAAQSPQTPLAGSAIPQFMQPLPTLSAGGGTISTVYGNQPLTIRMCEFDSTVLPPGTPLAVGATGRTRVWGYIVGDACPVTPQDTYTGPAIVNFRGLGSTDITWVNDLGTGAGTQVLAWKYSTDQTLHWADPLGLNPDGGPSLGPEANACNMMGGVPAYLSPCAQNYRGPIPTVPHLHGGEVPPELDGGPDAWFTSDGAVKGHGYYSFAGSPGNGAIYKYPNRGEAAPIWFHDHALGITRLNVYAGLAGAYLIADPNLVLPAGLAPAGLSYPGTGRVELTVPVVIQDRMFDANGQLFFPADTAANLVWTPNPDHPYWVPEFVGDSIVVNGKAWPYFNVEPKRYRFWFVNGSNARTYEMFLVNPVTKSMGPPVYVIATDGGYLDAPVNLDPNLGQRLTMMPGERYEVIVDFAGVPPGTNLILRNTGRTPYPKGAPPNGSTLGQIVQFRVGACTSGFCGAGDTSFNPVVAGAVIRTDAAQKIVRLANPATGALAPGVTAAKTRQLTLNEVMGMPATAIDPVTGLPTAYPGGPLEILVNNTKWSGASPRPYGDFTPITVNGVTTAYSELPTEGDTEVWEIVNLTADAHPIHLHLVQFQLVNRQGFNTSKYNAAYAAAFPAVTGDPKFATCIGGVFCPGFGPPKDYRAAQNPLSGGRDGGNPDITPSLQGPIRPPLPQEAGWKDTVIMNPGEVTRIAVRWAPTDLPTTALASELYFPFDPSDGFQHGYVWHCHIIDHVDNEMMRPDVVQLNALAPPPGARPLVKGVAY
jgi:FtsP/CotA-like multicopper oxidase with cupredoxin domain